MKTEEVIQADYIIAGAGCAGLSLALMLKRSGLNLERVILIDAELKNRNDRTWCFWTKEQNAWYKDIVSKSWSQFEFRSPGLVKQLTLSPYSYQMLRGEDFYNYVNSELASDKRFELRNEKIQELRSTEFGVELTTDENRYRAKLGFNSAFRMPDRRQQHINYVQHFKGWVVECDEAVFQPELPVFMDFTFAAREKCEFYYVLPYSAKRALIEFTGFSKNVLTEESYFKALRFYLEEKLGIQNYRVVEEETGQIPMYESDFRNPFGKFVVNIGTAAGASKTSTGYTFHFIQKHVQQIVNDLQKGMTPRAFQKSPRYKFYDSVLLKVIDQSSLSPSDLFADILTKNSTKDTLAFLNEESSFAQDLGIMSSVPSLPFIKASVKKLFRR